MARKLTFIINPIAGPGNNLLFWDKLAKQLKKNNIRFRTKITKRQNHAAKLAIKRVKKEKKAGIVSVGGDGTFNEVASTLVNSETTLAHIPRGSGNGLARMLKIPAKRKNIVRYLTKGKAKLIDAGKVYNQYFFCTAGFGFDALISHHFANSKSRGLKSYIFHTFKTLLDYQGVSANFELDGEAMEGDFFTVTFANANQFGNNAFIAPKAELDDGWLDVTIIRKFPRIYLPLVAMALFGKFIHKFSFVEIRKVKSANITQLSQNYFHRDGDISEVVFPAKINVVPKALRILIPGD
jgi:YegS/Rv2252/BmrU family lipid kinase